MSRCTCTTLPHQPDCPMADDPVGSRAAQAAGRESAGLDFDEWSRMFRLDDDQSVDVCLLRAGGRPGDRAHHIVCMHIVGSPTTFILHDLTAANLKDLAGYLSDYARHMEAEFR
jgi:hypothetical protein